MSELSQNEQRRVRDVLRRFDTDDAATRDDCWKQLPPGRLALPLLREAFPKTRRMEARISMVYEATFFARERRRLPTRAARLADRSKHDALPALRPLLRTDDEVTRQAAEGAVDAIKHQNHHLYWDQGGPEARRSGSLTAVTIHTFQTLDGTSTVSSVDQ